MAERKGLESKLAPFNRKRRLPKFIAEASRLLSIPPDQLEISSLDRMQEIQSNIKTQAWGVTACYHYAEAEVAAFIRRLAANEELPVWLVGCLDGQFYIGAVKASVKNVLPVWLEINWVYGCLDMVASDEETWVTIHWEDLPGGETFSIEAFGRWAEYVEAKPGNLWHANRNIRDAYEGGEAWLATLPALIEDLTANWSLKPEPKTRGNYSFVIPCGDVVLKLLPPGEGFDRELGAMLAWNGNGAAKIEKHDPRGAMLIERLRPGTELTALYHEGRDEEATAIACSLMPTLAVKAAGPWPTAADRASELNALRKRFNGKTGPFPERLVEAAETLSKELIPSQGEPHLIHADLHHENILQSERGWLAIDPHGLIAEREFETYAWLNNPIGLSENPDLRALCERRLDQIADLTGFDREHIRGWGIACAVLSAWWSFADHNNVDNATLAVAETLLSVRAV